MSSTLVERFELLGELGRGGMGVVHRARERATGREVALKVLAPGAHDPELVLRARREAEALAAVRHPGIVAVHAAGESEGRPWIACELVAGARPLDRAWAELDRAGRVGLVREVARALGHAHARGVVHRDLKPQNVLVGSDGRARLTDFGLALLQGAERLTATGTLLGTPTAMAPEQVRGDRTAIGTWTDTWALGVLLYEALTGRRPFQGRTVWELGLRVLEADPAPPRALDPMISPALEAVALRALRRDPGARYPDGEAFADALEAALRAPSAPRRGPLRALALGVGLAGLLGLAGLATSRRDAALPPSPAPVGIHRPSSRPPGPPPAPAAAPTPALVPDREEEQFRSFLQERWRTALGVARLEGARSLPRDPVRAEAWLRAAAELDQDPEAMVRLGQALVDDRAPLGRIDLEEGEVWLRRATALQHPEGMFWLASHLEHRDPAEAAHWAEQAVVRGRGGHAWRVLARLKRKAGDHAGAARALAMLWSDARVLLNHGEAIVELADLHLQGIAAVATADLRARLEQLRDARRDEVGTQARERLAALERAGAR